MATRRAITSLLQKSKATPSLLCSRPLKVPPRLPHQRVYTTFSQPRQLAAVPEPTGMCYVLFF